MTWFDRLVKGSRNRSSVGDSRVSSVHRHSRDHEDKVRQEQEDQALALSLALAEEEQLERLSQLEADEAFARSLQASLDLGRADPPVSDDQAGPVIRNLISPSPASILEHFKPRFSDVRCAGCQRAIGNETFLNCMNGFWHPKCFRCGHCGSQIKEQRFVATQDKPYHIDCHKELFHPRCEVCSFFIPVKGDKIEFLSHPFWGQKYCPAHHDDGTHRCCSCERLEPRESAFTWLDDGRKLCLDCLDTCVMDTDECQPLIREVLAFFHNLDMTIRQDIPILLVERQALNDAGAQEGKCDTTQVRGLCLSEEQTISMVSFKRAPRFLGSRTPFSGKGTEYVKLSRESSVTTVLVLYGLPRLLTGAILAHELMHAWFRLNGADSFSRLSRVVEEGMCQVMAYHWLSSQLGNHEAAASSAARTSVSERLGVFYLNQIQLDPSPCYGHGFRLGQEAVTKHGLKATLEHIRLTGSFPL